MQLRIISAGAGSGKTYRLTNELIDLLKAGKDPSGIIATTFTKKAAAELQERVRQSLLEEQLLEEADLINNALIGTVHGLGVKLLKRFAFEAGVSPGVSIIAEEDQQLLFNQALSAILSTELIVEMDALSTRLGFSKSTFYDWRIDVKKITEIARANDFDDEVLKKSASYSIDSFREFIGKPHPRKSAQDFDQALRQSLQITIGELEANTVEIDGTKTTKAVISKLKGINRELALKEHLPWYRWAEITKIKPGKKSGDIVTDLQHIAQQHIEHPQFHQDIERYISCLFDIASKAIIEYSQHKKKRGLIDYTDMESLVNQLLDNTAVQEALRQEVSVLMVDEFQDTSPLQLSIFLKLAELADIAIWVGDPKQSIYGFRGAEPRLMQAIIEHIGIRPEDIQQYSWRSREDVVHVTNAIFTKAFPELPVEQVALQPKRCKKAHTDSANTEDEPSTITDGILHWHIQFDGEGRKPSITWLRNALAQRIKEFLAEGKHIIPKGSKQARPIRAGDIAVLCRTNGGCTDMAASLHQVGINAAIARTGLLATAESQLILACLKYLHHQKDNLAIAEILSLGQRWPLIDIITNRLQFVKREENKYQDWLDDDFSIIDQLNEIRPQTTKLSSFEIVDYIITALDLRRIIVQYGESEQRIANVEILRKLALDYEDSCNRLQSAASLGGFLLWLEYVAAQEKDYQNTGENQDAVNLLTYHKSKGLEWPVTICFDLTTNLRADVWGVEIIPTTEQVDLQNVLANRILRFWVNPYADQYRKTAFEENISASQAQANKTQQALAEEARLLYVGITRARDYLVLPTSHIPSKWLNRTFNNGQESHTVLEAGVESPFEWQQQFVPLDQSIVNYDREFEQDSGNDYNTRAFFAPPRGKQNHEKKYWNKNLQQENLEFPLALIANQQYHPPVVWENKEDSDREINDKDVAKVINITLAADRLDYDKKQRLDIATKVVHLHQLEDILSPQRLVQQMEHWHKMLETYLAPKQIIRHYPIKQLYQQKVFETTIDFLIATKDGLAIIRNSHFSGDNKQLNKAAKSIAPYLYLAKMALAQIHPQTQIQTFIHFPLEGILKEVEL